MFLLFLFIFISLLGHVFFLLRNSCLLMPSFLFFFSATPLLLLFNIFSLFTFLSFCQAIIKLLFLKSASAFKKREDRHRRCRCSLFVLRMTFVLSLKRTIAYHVARLVLKKTIAYNVRLLLRLGRPAAAAAAAAEKYHTPNHDSSSHLSLVENNRFTFLDHVHHPSSPSNLKRFSSVNITFLKSTWFVMHLLALPSLASLCFLVSVILFLILAYLSPISCSFLCTVRTLTSSSYLSFIFFAVTFSLDDNNLVTLLFIPSFCSLGNCFFSVLFSSSSAHSHVFNC
ncbi:unnamed protein product [Acanthosepion pharaonis]|uniref:Uncharacterized protein n=1 Tax=Acanthosepion pharaonis TaxID=158019 RepID=A0A812EJK1_ACAPH|nr:unnamed protein product [Sepia pharaonis]